MTLLCEYALYMGQHALAFVIMGCCYRSLRLLSLDAPEQQTGITEPAEHGDSDDVSDESRALEITRVESGRRLVWSCYVLDSFIGAGVDENLEWRDHPPRVALPCDDHSFVAQVVSAPPRYLPLADNSFSDGEGESLRALNLRSQIVQLAQLRTRVLRYVFGATTLFPVSPPLLSFSPSQSRQLTC